MSAIQNNIARVRERIASALHRSGREGERVTIVGVTKTFGADVVMELIRAGITDVGENRIQEFLDKATQVTLPCRWHLIGTLQRNKASKALGRFALIHSIDSLKLAQTLNRLGEEKNEQSSVLIEVNTSGEATKHGFETEEVVEAAGQIAELPHITLKGLMTIGPFTDDRERIRRSFKDLYRLKETLNRSLDASLTELSMGMSDDFDIAVEEGSTIVRLGRTLLGERG